MKPEVLQNGLVPGAEMDIELTPEKIRSDRIIHLFIQQIHVKHLLDTQPVLLEGEKVI